jgi:hypothetical protein
LSRLLNQRTSSAEKRQCTKVLVVIRGYTAHEWISVAIISLPQVSDIFSKCFVVVILPLLPSSVVSLKLWKVNHSDKLSNSNVDLTTAVEIASCGSGVAFQAGRSGHLGHAGSLKTPRA